MKTLFIVIALLNITLIGQDHKYSVPEKKDTLIPKGYYLDPHYPNPFSPVTFTYFGVPDTCYIKMFISDSLNQNILDTVYIGKLAPGNYKFSFYKFIDKIRNQIQIFKGYINLEAYFERKGFMESSTIFKARERLIWL